MEVHGFTENGSIEATIGDIPLIVPNDTANRHRQMIAEWEAEGNTVPPYVPPAVTDPAVSLVEIAGARLSADYDNWSVTGVERSKGIAGADIVDVDVVWVFFVDPQPDTDYIVIPSTDITKYTDFVEVSRPGLTEIAFIVQRVQ